MDELMQTLYSYILDFTYDKYCAQTDYDALCDTRDAIGRRLWEQLEGEQRNLLEELQRAYDRAQMRELEVMFLAAFDESAALLSRHTT